MVDIIGSPCVINRETCGFNNKWDYFFCTFSMLKSNYQIQMLPTWLKESKEIYLHYTDNVVFFPLFIQYQLLCHCMYAKNRQISARVLLILMFIPCVIVHVYWVKWRSFFKNIFPTSSIALTTTKYTNKTSSDDSTYTQIKLKNASSVNRIQIPRPYVKERKIWQQNKQKL